MKKIIVIGCPGSGKSTFARKIRDVIRIPLYHLDMLFWNEDKTTVTREILTERIREVMENPEWIIDGNYASTMEMRFEKCDTVFFLDYPTEVCLKGIEERQGIPRSDMPWIESESDEEFRNFVRSFNDKIRPEIICLINKYSEKNIVVFRSREQADKFLSDIQ